MKPTEYKYKNFTLTFYEYQCDLFINITCMLNGKGYNRVYDIDEDIIKIVIDEKYVYLNYDNNSQYVIKFEGNASLIIDTFDNKGEHLEVIGCHDFWDDVSFF